MQESRKNSWKKLERYGSAKKNRFSPMIVRNSPSKNPFIIANAKCYGNYASLALSSLKRSKQINIKKEYAITESDDGAHSRGKSRTSSNDHKFKQIERKHKNKIQRDIEEHRLKLKSRRSQHSVGGSFTTYSPASKDNRSN